MTTTDLRASVQLLIVGAIGAALAYYLTFPAPFLIGPALSVTVASFSGMRFALPAFARNVCFIVIGISMGTSISPEVVRAARTWPASFLLLIPAIVVIFYAAYFLLRRVYRYDRQTAMLAASPGHLSFILSLGAESRSDVMTISVIQSVRVLALTLLVPPIIDLAGLAATGPADPAPVMEVTILALEIAFSALVGYGFLRLKFPAALLLGGVAVSASTHVTGLVSGSVPAWLLTPTYIVLGSLIGSRFSGVSIRSVKDAILAGVAVTLVVTVIAGAIAAFVCWVTGVPLNAVLIAFAPGGLETMAAMAVMMHVDATYVGAHHVIRLLFLSVFMPLLMRRNRMRETASPS
ncbi:AbrB family transcriptional regulator [Rhizobiaceae bacterium n13]|uniref:AbrB family transcriptional regulator n=1 Tax=Ferirhizobium litorale TaxID=2927786 RepID=A0AAE3U3S1_9HYPH|nr:AbrB family transcriptional regulator [Fererhizobium litorale]MDI7863479.1 AbrB family transcriptional regulator [Fererhizobium litorale]MDI7922244.1 AbrB family transcriptional regulator [Fererhizobium litorale]